jgi:hypothetical protein
MSEPINYYVYVKFSKRAIAEKNTAKPKKVFSFNAFKSLEFAILSATID